MSDSDPFINGSEPSVYDHMLSLSNISRVSTPFFDFKRYTVENGRNQQSAIGHAFKALSFG